MNQILCLDFDGVIFDSQKECLLVSYLAYKKIQSKDVRKHSLDEIPKEIFELFYKYRYLVRPAWQYLVLIEMLFKNKKINSKTFKLSCDYNYKHKSLLESSFFNIRSKLMNESIDTWISFNPPYPEVVDSWSKIKHFDEVYLVTNKNYHPVVKLLKFYKLNIEEKNIFSQEKIKRKIDTLTMLKNRHNIEYYQTYFVDDSIYYFSQALDAGFNSYLAGWGYEKNNISRNKLPREKVLNNFNQILDITTFSKKRINK